MPPPEEADPTYTIGFDAGGWLVAEQMIVARYLMYQSLYFHKTKRIFELHLQDFLRAWLKERYESPEFPEALDEYLRLTDSTVWADVRAAASVESAAGHEHAARLFGRTQMRLAKELILADNYRVAPSTHGTAAVSDATTGSDRPPSGRRIPVKKRFDKLAEHVRMTFGYAVVRSDQPDHSATKMFNDAHKIRILVDDKPRYLDDVSEIVRGMSDKIWRGRIYSDKQAIKDVGECCTQWLAEHPVREFLSDGKGK